MITYQNRSGNVRAIVRRKGIGSKSKTFPTKGLAKTWAERIEREFAERDLQGNWSKKETQIFPRFHQWSAVNAMIADAKRNGAGMSYLCEHSAGSGKTSTIAWTAHDLVKLRRDNGDRMPPSCKRRCRCPAKAVLRN